MAIESKLLSEQPARDRAEHGAMHNAVRVDSVSVPISILSSCISLLLYINGFQIVVRKRVILYGTRAAFNGIFEEEKVHRTYILGFNAQYQSLIMERFISSRSRFQMTDNNTFLAVSHADLIT